MDASYERLVRPGPAGRGDGRRRQPNDRIGGSGYNLSQTQTARGTGMVKVVPSRQFTGVAEVPRRHRLSTGPPSRYRPPTYKYRPQTAGHLKYIHAYTWYM